MFPQLNKSFQKLILNPKPNFTWKLVRFLLHWTTLPLKLLLIGGLGLYQIVKHTILDTNRAPKPITDTLDVDKLLKSLPIWDNGHIKSYVNRVPAGEAIDGLNHNFDHQCSRHSTYAFLLSQLNPALRDAAVEKGVWNHLQGKYLARGYKADGTFNVKTVSGDMLCGLNLAMLNSESLILQDRFEVLVDNLIQNDYSLLEGQRPDGEPILEEIYDEALVAAQNRPENVLMKSARGMWQPGLETVGAQALTILAALRVADVKLRSKTAGAEYRKLLKVYGFGLLSLFPTAYTDTRRGYFNDHNCMIALYTLAKLSSSSWGRAFWKIPMVYVWKLSKHWYNAYFTGLLFDAYPELLKNASNVAYLKKCIAYLQEVQVEEITKAPINWVGEEMLTTIVPVGLKLQKEDEFYPDMGHNILQLPEMPIQYYRTGLGYLAGVTMCMKALAVSDRLVYREVSPTPVARQSP